MRRTRQLLIDTLKTVLHKFQLQHSFQLLLKKQRGGKQTVNLPFMKYFEFNSFGPNCSSETSVISVDVQLKQLVIFYSKDTEK